MNVKSIITNNLFNNNNNKKHHQQQQQHQQLQQQLSTSIDSNNNNVTLDTSNKIIIEDLSNCNLIIDKSATKNDKGDGDTIDTVTIDNNNNDDNYTLNDEYNDESNAHLQSYRKRRSTSAINSTTLLTAADKSKCQQLINIDENYVYKLAKNYKLMSKFIKEQNIYSDPKFNYKRRTICINKKNNLFGFDLQVCK